LEELCRHYGILNKVKFLGALPFNKVQEIYAESHFLIMPGTREGWPKTLGEAWAHYCIPLAVSSCLVPEIILEGQNGFLFEPDPKSLAQLLLTVLGLDKNELMVLSQRSHENVHDISLENFESRLKIILQEYFSETLL